MCHHPGVGERKLRLPLGKVSDKSVHQTVTGEGRLARKRSNCADISFCGLWAVVLSMILTLQECFCCLEFNSPGCSHVGLEQKGLADDALDTRVTWWPCSWRH